MSAHCQRQAPTATATPKFPLTGAGSSPPPDPAKAAAASADGSISSPQRHGQPERQWGADGSLRKGVRFLLQRPPSSKGTALAHCFGVNALAFDDNGLNARGPRLISAGRDSIIRCWLPTPPPSPPTPSKGGYECVGSFEHHTDWVNDIVLCANQTMVSCSSDTTVKVWSMDNVGTEASQHHTTVTAPKHTINCHNDYVKALAYSPVTHHVASAGLDRKIFVWDLNLLMSNIACLDDGHDTAPVNMNERQSIYSMAMSHNGNTLVTGTTEKVLRVWDVRSGQRQFKLRGHRDNIRALLINDDATLCISASSDSTIRIWDLGQQQCVHTYNNLHSDSVWALATDQSFSKLFSGGRDKNVFVTNMSTGESVLLCKESAPVLRLLLPKTDTAHLWTATTNPQIKKWRVEPEQEGTEVKTVQTALEKRFAMRRSRSISASKAAASIDSSPALMQAPHSIIQGRPGIIRSQILNDRMRILTQDSAGCVELWDVTQAVRTQSFGPVPFEDKVKELYQRVSIPNWFSVDTKTGCFNAELYAFDAGLPVPNTDHRKVNLGEQILHSLFASWLDDRTKSQPPADEACNEKEKEPEKSTEPKQQSTGETSGETSQNSENNQEGDTNHHGSQENQNADKPEDRTQKQQSTTENNDPNASESSSSSNTNSKPAATDPLKRSPLPRYTMPPDTAVIISKEGTGATLFRSALCDLSKAPDRVVPHWTRRCLLNGEKSVREKTTFSFRLLPTDTKDLPFLPECGPNTKLTAHRAVKIQTVLEHIVKKLALELPMEGDTPVSPSQYLQMTCNSQVLSPEEDLGTVKMLVWKSGADMVLYYQTQPQWLHHHHQKDDASSITSAVPSSNKQ